MNPIEILTKAGIQPTQKLLDAIEEIQYQAYNDGFIDAQKEYNDPPEDLSF